MSAEATPLLLKANLKQLKLPTMLAEWEKMAHEAAAHDEPYEAYLLRLSEAEVPDALRMAELEDQIAAHDGYTL